MDALVERHRRACDAFARVADAVPTSAWTARTPCPDWDARALVEHVIGFHEVLILRPLDVRAHRPREGPAERWRATMNALIPVLEPMDLLRALTADVLVHTWDLGRATGVDPGIDPLYGTVYAAVASTELPRNEMIGPACAVADDADDLTKLAAYYGRDPAWTTPVSG